MLGDKTIKSQTQNEQKIGLVESPQKNKGRVYRQIKNEASDKKGVMF